MTRKQTELLWYQFPTTQRIGFTEFKSYHCGFQAIDWYYRNYLETDD